MPKIITTDPETKQKTEEHSSFAEAWEALGKKVQDKLGDDTWLNLYISEDGEIAESWCLSL